MDAEDLVAVFALQSPQRPLIKLPSLPVVVLGGFFQSEREGNRKAVRNRPSVRVKLRQRKSYPHGTVVDALCVQRVLNGFSYERPDWVLVEYVHSRVIKTLTLTPAITRKIPAPRHELSFDNEVSG